MDVRVIYAYDDEADAWGLRIPSLGIVGSGSTRAEADEQARAAILFTLEDDTVDLPRHPRMELTEADAAALERGGLALHPLDDLGPDDPIVKTVALYASLLASSLTVSQIAHILGVSTGRVRQELYAGSTYGIKDTGAWRLPRWQFTDDLTGLLPGIRRVLPRLDRGIHPVAVYTWFASPDLDLTIDENEEIMLSPRDWLRSGRNPQVVADLAGALGIAP